MNAEEIMEDIIKICDDLEKNKNISFYATYMSEKLFKQYMCQKKS